MSTNLIFAFTSDRVDDDILSEVEDALDDACDAEDDWDIISWKRTAASRFIIYAPVECRSIVHDPELKLKTRPSLQLRKDMKKSGNVWMVPECDTESEAQEEALDIVADWEADFLSKDNLEMDRVEQDQDDGIDDSDDEEDQEPEDDRPKLESVSTYKVSPREELLKAFNITQEEGESWFTMEQDIDPEEDDDKPSQPKRPRGFRRRESK